MAEEIQLLRLGAATIGVINVGDLAARLDEWITVPEEERPPEYAPLFAQPLRIPTQCVLIDLDGVTTLIDAGAYELEPNSPFELPGYQPPPGLPAALAEMNVQLSDIA
ncbi:MAG TPA: hypothetical protein VHB98_08285, partial [Chloroflexota bacterium]|nr:hypothetical protein [Chloroflexota bacterium]